MTYEEPPLKLPGFAHEDPLRITAEMPRFVRFERFCLLPFVGSVSNAMEARAVFAGPTAGV